MTLVHPLCGADLGTLVSVLRRYGPPSAAKLPATAIALGAALGRAPFTAVEAWRAPKRIAAEPMRDAPIFILGHWRSGTTHLYNLLSVDPQFGYVSPLATGMPWDLLGLTRWLRPMLERALPEHRYIDNVAVTPTAPQEDEAAIANMCPVSFYHALYFPRRFREAFLAGVFFDGASDADIARWRKAVTLFLDKVSIDQGGRRLVVKNPTYTARLKMLRAIWPDAQFIHIRRNPYVVFYSMRNFHQKLSAALGLQTDAPQDVDAVVLETYARMMDALEADAADLPAERYIDVKYEDLTSDPLDALGRIYGQLKLPGFETARPHFETALSGVRDYKKNVYAFEDAALKRVGEAWAAHIEKGGYAPPA